MTVVIAARLDKESDKASDVWHGVKYPRSWIQTISDPGLSQIPSLHDELIFVSCVPSAQQKSVSIRKKINSFHNKKYDVDTLYSWNITNFCYFNMQADELHIDILQGW